MFDRRLLGEAGKVRFLLAMGIGLGLGAGSMAILQASFLARIVDRVFLGRQTLAEVWPWLWPLLGVILFRAGLAWAGELAAQRAASLVKHHLRQRLLDHLLALGPEYAGGGRSGELVNVLTEGIEALDAYFSRYLPQLALAALVPLAVLAFVFPLDLLSGAILFFTAPLIPLFMFLIGRRAEAMTQRQWESLSRMSGHFLDVLQGLTTLKIFGRSKAQAEVVRKISSSFRETTLGVLRVAFLSALVLEFLATISTALVAVTVGMRLVYDRVFFEQAFFLLLLAPEFYLPLRLLGSHFHAGMAGVTAARRIFEILETPLPGKHSRENASLPEDSNIHIVFSNVHCAFEDGRRQALNGVSFEIRPGERVALVGPSGSGKTTVARLLSRFIDPSSGEITVGGIPLEDIPADRWRKYIALVPQYPYLFYGTVAENISLGRPGATMDEVVAAAEMAGSHRFIMDLPRGYRTPVGEMGFSLSGGQAQRLAIARAFLKDAPILIMDEATANLDPSGERTVLEAMERLMQGRTVLYIAHRLNTVRLADRILVLEGGQVVESGRHEELISNGGVYRRLICAFGGAA